MTDHSRGTRRQVLFALGLIWILTAVALITDQQEKVPGLLHTYLPHQIRAAVWAVPGLFALVAVWWRSRDATAWALLLVPPLERFVSFLIGWGFGLGAYPAGWQGVLLYATVMFLINRCAKGLDRPPTPFPLPKEQT